MATLAIRPGGAVKSYFHVTRNQHPWTCHEGHVLWGPPTKVVCHLPKKKYKRADLAGGDRFWAGTHTVWQYDISWFFLGLGSWLLTVTGMETLILTLIHQSLDINSHTSIFISYLYLYLNIKYIDLSLCGSSLPIHVIHPIPGPWLHANLAAQTNNADPQSIQGLWLMTVTDHIQRCPGTTICAKGIGSFIALRSMESQTVLLDSRRRTMVRQDALWWNWTSQAKMRASASLRQFWLTHADALHFQIQLSRRRWVRQRTDLAPSQGGGTILSPQTIIGAGHNYICSIKVWS